MPQHVTTQLRQAVMARLRPLPGLVAVHPIGRAARGFDRLDMPCLLVGVAESVALVSRSERTQRRTYAVSVQVLASDDSDTVDDTLDALSVPIEVALRGEADLGIGVEGWSLRDASPGRFEMGSHWYAARTLTFTGSLTTVEGDPTTSVFA